MRFLFGQHDWWYRVGFALINWVEASAELACLGQVDFGWIMKYARWYTVRSSNKQKAK